MYNRKVQSLNYKIEESTKQLESAKEEKKELLKPVFKEIKANGTQYLLKKHNIELETEEIVDWNYYSKSYKYPKIWVKKTLRLNVLEMSTTSRLTKDFVKEFLIFYLEKTDINVISVDKKIVTLTTKIRQLKAKQKYELLKKNFKYYSLADWSSILVEHRALYSAEYLALLRTNSYYLKAVKKEQDKKAKIFAKNKAIVKAILDKKLKKTVSLAKIKEKFNLCRQFDAEIYNFNIKYDTSITLDTCLSPYQFLRLVKLADVHKSWIEVFKKKGIDKLK